VELNESNCFGPATLHPLGVLGFGLLAAVLLARAWSPARGSILLRTWGSLFALGGGLLILRVALLGAFNLPLVVWAHELGSHLAFLLVVTAVPTGLTALLSRWRPTLTFLRRFLVGVLGYLLVLPLGALALFFASDLLLPFFLLPIEVDWASLVDE
jgi:hypothetical protein